MALQWDWNKKVGTMTLVQTIASGEKKEFEISLYQGNAFLIMNYEYEKDGKPMSDMYSFFVSEEHMRNCLGLNKKSGYGANYLDEPANRATKFRINKSKYTYTKKLVAALVEAFDNITIELYSDDAEGSAE